MEDLDLLIEILEASVKKGVVPLTNSHLLNILKMWERNQEKRSLQMEMYNSGVEE